MTENAAPTAAATRNAAPTAAVTDISPPTSAPDPRVAAQVRLGDQLDTHLVKVLGVGRLLPVRGRRDQRIATIAEQQCGRISRKQLLAAGVTDSMIHGMVHNARLIRLHQGVYAVGHLAPIEYGRETAALLAAREGAVLSHLTAAGLWKLRPPTSATDPVDITLTHRESSCRKGIRFHRTRTMQAEDVRTLGHLPITSPARTLLDIAELVSRRELERALDEALVNRLARADEVRRLLTRIRGRRASTLLESLLAARTGPTITRSQAEERFLALIREAELPLPEVNARVAGYEVDFLWREQGLALEVDGYRFHSSRRAFERDTAKGARLTAAGLQVMRVTWLQMEYERLAVIARLSQTLARAA